MLLALRHRSNYPFRVGLHFATTGAPSPSLELRSAGHISVRAAGTSTLRVDAPLVPLSSKRWTVLIGPTPTTMPRCSPTL